MEETHAETPPRTSPNPRAETPVDPAIFARALGAWEREQWDEAVPLIRALYESGRRQLNRDRAADEIVVPPATSNGKGPPRRPVLHDAVILYADSLYLGRRHREALAVLDEAEAAGLINADEAPVVLVRGWITLRHGDLERVHRRVNRLLAHAPELHPAWHGQALHLAGMVVYERGLPAAARDLLRDAVAIYRAAGDRRGLADSLNALGVVESCAFQLHEARRAMEEALRLNRELDRRMRVGVNLSNLCICYYKLGLLERSERALCESESLRDETAPFYERLLGQLARAKLLLLRGEPAAALPLAENAGRAARQRRYERETIIALEIEGDAALASNAWDRALARYHRALARAESHARGGALVPGLYRRRGEAYSRAGMLDQALAALNRAVETAGRCRELFEGAESRRLLAAVWRQRRNFPRAYREVRRALALAREHGAGLSHGQALLEAARIQHGWWGALGSGPFGSENGLCEAMAGDAQARTWGEADMGSTETGVGDAPALMAGPAVPASHETVLVSGGSRVDSEGRAAGDSVAGELAVGKSAAAASLIRGHLEAAWSYAVEAVHQFEALRCRPGRDEALAVLAALREHWQPPWADSPAARVLEGDQDTAFIARAPATLRVRRLLDLAADSEDPVLITGETGTGKELAARYLHARSRRSGGPLVAVNCGAIPATIFEREFFGHVAGAFTGATDDRAGFCEQAAGGTLFLDEVGEIPPALQVKLLRLLQERTFRRLGDPTERRADIRVVAATNADLLDAIARHRFRPDLYFRLQILEVRMPPLRERPHDVLALADLFTRQALGREVGFAALCTEGVVERLVRYGWPGNVRELEGLVRRLCVYIRRGGRITVGMLPEEMRRRGVGSGMLGGTARAMAEAAAGVFARAGGRRRAEDRDTLRLSERVAAAERAAIRDALAVASGNRAAAARLLGIGRGTLYRKMGVLGMNGNEDDA